MSTETATESRTLTYREAIQAALSDAMAADDSVFVFGEDVAVAGGPFKMTDGLYERFGSERVLDTPISEQAIIGVAIGAAIDGLRPVAEIMFSDFAAVCFDGIANEMPKFRYMTGGQVTVPATVRMSNGANGFAAQHSQPVENWFLNLPGLKIVLPSTPANAYGLLRAAIEDDDPVLFFEHRRLLQIKEEVPASLPTLELGVAETVRAGADVTVVAAQLMRHRALEAAQALAAEGIEVELIDPQSLIPLDLATIVASVERTNRLVVVQEAPPNGSWGASLVASLCRDQFELLDAPPNLVACDETPVPYAGELEEAWMPGVADIEAAIRETVAF